MFSYFIENFDGKIMNTNPLKLILLSGHDSTIGSLMVGLNITNYQCIESNYLNSTNITYINCENEHPPFASSI